MKDFKDTSDTEDLKEVVRGFLNFEGGDPSKFAELTWSRQYLECRWRERDIKVGEEVVSKATEREGLEANMTLGSSLGMALAILGLFVALAKDLVS